MLYTTDHLYSELQCSNVEDIIVLWLPLACMYLFSVLSIYGIVCLTDGRLRQVLCRKQYFAHLFLSVQCIKM